MSFGLNTGSGSQFEQRVDAIGAQLPGIRRIEQEFGQLVTDLDKEAALDQAMLEEFNKRPPAEDPSTDISALKKADPSFVDTEFIVIARDTFYIVLRARADQNADLGKAELGPQLEADLASEIDSDKAAHRRRNESMVEIEDAKIIKGMFVGGKMLATVRFSLSGSEADVDISSGASQTLGGRSGSWTEDWTFARDPSVNTDAEDQRLAVQGEQWFVAHKGWTVTHIVKNGAPDQDAV